MDATLKRLVKTAMYAAPLIVGAVLVAFGVQGRKDTGVTHQVGLSDLVASTVHADAPGPGSSDDSPGDNDSSDDNDDNGGSGDDGDDDDA